MKQFEIEINGIKESIDLTDQLIKELDLLESKIKDLGNLEINFNIEDLRKQIKDSNTEWNSVSKRLKEINEQINNLEKKKLDSNNVDKYNNSLSKLENVAKKAVNEQDKLKGIKNYDTEKAVQGVDKLTNSLKNAIRAEDQLGTKITVNVAGMALEFDDVNQGIGVLEDKLYQLSSTGQKDTAVFREITQEIARLRLNVTQVDAAVDNAFSGGLSKMMSTVSGVTGLAGAAVGLQQLFGIDDSTLNESIQKFTALSLVMQGVSTMQQEMAKEGSFLGNVLKGLNGGLNQLFIGLGKVFSFLGQNRFTKFNKNFSDNLAFIKYWGKDLNVSINETLENAAEQLNNFTLKEFPEQKKTLFDNLIKQTNKENPELASQMTVEFFQNQNTDFSNLNIPDSVKDSVDNYNNKIKALISIENELTKKVQLFNKVLLSSNGNMSLAGKAVNLLIKTWGILPNILKKGIIALKNAAVACKGLTVAIKTLAKSTIILWALQEVVEALSAAWEWLLKVWNQMKGDNMTDRLEHTKNVIESTDKALQNYINDLNQLEATGAISASTKIQKSIEATKKALLEATNALRAYKDIDAKPMAFESDTWFNTKDLTNIKDINKYFEILQKAVEANTDEMQQLKKESQEVQDNFGGVNFVKELWYTASDAVDDYRTLQKRYIQDLVYDIQRINFNKPSKELDKFYKKLNSKEVQASLGNITELFDEKLAEQLKARIEQVNNYLTEIKKLNDDQLIEDRKTQDTITSNNISAIKDRFKRERAELSNQRKLELRDASDNEALKQSIVNKYNAKEQELLRKQGNEIRNIQNQINNNRLETLEDGLKKQLAKLEQQRKQEIQSAKDSEILVGEQIVAINKKYDKMVLDAKRDFYKNREKLLDDYKEKYRQVQNEIANMEYEFVDKKIQLSTDPSNIKNIQNYYKELRDLQNEQARRQKDIQIDKEEYSTEQNIKEEEKRNKDLLNSLEENYKKGLLTKKDYDKLVEDEMNLHYQKLDLIVKQKEQNISEIQLNELKTRQNNNSAYLQKQITDLQKYYQSIEQPDERIKPASSKQWNIYLDNLKEVQNKVNETSKVIDDAFQKGDIDFPEFESAKEQVSSFNKDIKERMKDGEEASKNALQNQIQFYTQQIMQYAQVANTMWSMVSDMWQNQLEQEENRLQEEYDTLEEAYNKQEELTQKHSDKLNDIEEELKTSRGDRRAHLIEQLNAERAALLENEAEEQRIAKEKEKIEKQQEQLEKKKRKKEKADNISSAIMSTLTGAANALSVKPAPVGMALAAVITALGMAKVAQISSMKYEKGGLLTGPSHKQGGIPVGNTGIEVEGNEYIVNKVATKENLPLLEYINKTNKKVSFENGGILPNISLPNDKGVYINDDRPVVVQVVDIINKADNYKKVQVMAGLKS